MPNVFGKTAEALGVIRQAVAHNLLDDGAAIINEAIVANLEAHESGPTAQAAPAPDPALDPKPATEAEPWGFGAMTPEEVQGLRDMLAAWREGRLVPPAFSAFDPDGDGKPGGAVPRKVEAVPDVEKSGYQGPWPESGLVLVDEGGKVTLTVDVSVLGLPAAKKADKAAIATLFGDAVKAAEAVEAAFPKLLDEVDIAVLHDDTAGDEGASFTFKGPAD